MDPCAIPGTARLYEQEKGLAAKVSTVQGNTSMFMSMLMMFGILGCCCLMAGVGATYRVRGANEYSSVNELLSSHRNEHEEVEVDADLEGVGNVQPSEALPQPSSDDEEQAHGGWQTLKDDDESGWE